MHALSSIGGAYINWRLSAPALSNLAIYRILQIVRGGKVLRFSRINW